LKILKTNFFRFPSKIISESRLECQIFVEPYTLLMQYISLKSEFIGLIKKELSDRGKLKITKFTKDK
jgi:hypothetical protein